MARFNVGEVWWIHFPYEDDSEIKRRPAIVIDSDMIAILALYVTSKAEAQPYKIEIEDWKEAGLKKPSFARIDKVARLASGIWIRRLETYQTETLLKLYSYIKKLLQEQDMSFL